RDGRGQWTWLEIRFEIAPRVGRRDHFGERPEAEPSLALGDRGTGQCRRTVERHAIQRVLGGGPQLATALPRGAATVRQLEKLRPIVRVDQTINQTDELVQITPLDQLVHRVTRAARAS